MGAATEPSGATSSETASVGARVRELRLRLGFTQAELAGPDYSAAYVSTIETGRRTPSAAVLRYLARRLGVEVTDLSTKQGATWALDLARELRSDGHSSEARSLLTRTLTTLAAAGRVAPSVLVVLHREIARSDLGDEAAERHVRRALSYAAEGDVAATELALTHVVLGDVLSGRGRDRAAAAAYREAAAVLLSLLRRPIV